ncbi:hypothetical protein GQR58_029473 [Nymphon striatum]|nr:hypothetical protein GQR58_029473 [Nymphon striatum]
MSASTNETDMSTPTIVQIVSTKHQTDYSKSTINPVSITSELQTSTNIPSRTSTVTQTKNYSTQNSTDYSKSTSVKPKKQWGTLLNDECTDGAATQGRSVSDNLTLCCASITEFMGVFVNYTSCQPNVVCLCARAGLSIYFRGQPMHDLNRGRWVDDIAKFDRDWVERAADREDWRSRREAFAQQWAC